MKKNKKTECRVKLPPKKKRKVDRKHHTASHVSLMKRAEIGYSYKHTHTVAPKRNFK